MYTGRRQKPGQPAPGQPAAPGLGAGGFAQAQPNTNNPGVHQHIGAAEQHIVNPQVGSQAPAATPTDSYPYPAHQGPGGYFAYDPQTKTRVTDVTIPELGVIQAMKPVDLRPKPTGFAIRVPTLDPLPTDRTNTVASFGNFNNGSPSQSPGSPNTLGSAPTKDIKSVPKIDFTPLQNNNPSLQTTSRSPFEIAPLDLNSSVNPSGRIDFNERIDQIPKIDNNPFCLTPRYLRAHIRTHILWFLIMFQN